MKKYKDGCDWVRKGESTAAKGANERKEKLLGKRKICRYLRINRKNC